MYQRVSPVTRSVWFYQHPGEAIPPLPRFPGRAAALDGELARTGREPAEVRAEHPGTASLPAAAAATVAAGRVGSNAHSGVSRGQGSGRPPRRGAMADPFGARGHDNSLPIWLRAICTSVMSTVPSPSRSSKMS